MREIKFKAWDKRFGVMSEVDSIGLNFGSGYTCYEGEPVKDITKEDINGLNIHAGTEDSNIVLMQYTGLKDKNGKEIYEGDIVEYEASIFPDIIKKTKVVEFKDAGFYPLSNSYYLLADKFEVIGNIYENPNLI